MLAVSDSTYITALWISGGLTFLGSAVAASLGIVNGRKLRTNHGKKIGEHVEEQGDKLDLISLQLSDLIVWSHIHTEQDNEIRAQLGITRAAYPDLAAWRNASPERRV